MNIHRDPITKESLVILSEGFPDGSNPRSFELFENKEGEAFGTFCVTLTSGNFQHTDEPRCLTFNKPGTKRGDKKKYLACFIPIYSKKFELKVFMQTGFISGKNSGTYQILEEAPWNILILYETINDSSISITRSFVEESGTTVISFSERQASEEVLMN